MKGIEHPVFFTVAIIVSPVVGTFVGRTLSDMGLIFGYGFDWWVNSFPALAFSNAFTALGGIIFSLPVVLLYGVPVFFLLKWLRMQNVWMFGLFGALPPTIGAAILRFRSDAPLPEFYVYSYSHNALTGISVACFCWLIALYLPARLERRNMENRGTS